VLVQHREALFTDMDTQKIDAMKEGGRALGKVKGQLYSFTKVGTRFEEIEAEAQRLIKAAGYTPSFSTVPGYDWATCIMKNDEMCHGIPQKKSVEDGDVLTIDVGLINKGYHLDTTMTFAVGSISEEIVQFLERGQRILDDAIGKARLGNSVYDISFAMEKGLKKYNYGAVYQLTGHGIGKELHMDPAVPCVTQRSDKRKKLVVGQTLAIEVMYTSGDPYLVEDTDGWTYRTEDGSLSGMFEETVLITKSGPQVMTKTV